MINMPIIVWIFPILFIFHDFEEIIFIKAWMNKNRHYLSKKYPVLSKKLLPHFENITTSSFALGVAEEFMLISIVTIISYILNWYGLWIGLFAAFTLHLLLHCFQALIIGKYVPAVVTSVICLPVCMYIIKLIIQSFPLNTIILYSVFGITIMAVNIIIIHKSMNIFNKWLIQYEYQDQ